MLNRREQLAGLQQAEAVEIRRKSDAFAERVEEFRKFFLRRAPFNVPGGELRLEAVRPAYEVRVLVCRWVFVWLARIDGQQQHAAFTAPAPLIHLLGPACRSWTRSTMAAWTGAPASRPSSPSRASCRSSRTCLSFT
jgi:hypothetical protein